MYRIVESQTVNGAGEVISQSFCPQKKRKWLPGWKKLTRFVHYLSKCNPGGNSGFYTAHYATLEQAVQRIKTDIEADKEKVSKRVIVHDYNRQLIFSQDTMNQLAELAKTYGEKERTAALAKVDWEINGRPE